MSRTVQKNQSPITKQDALRNEVELTEKKLNFKQFTI